MTHFNTPHIIHKEEVDSTNNYLKNLLSNHNLIEFTTVVATDQTKGRGQRGNYWESEKGKNLTFSTYLTPYFLPINKQFILSQVISLAILDTLSIYTSIDNLKIKWPNDIYYKDKKICGILIENALIDDLIQCTIAGIGININQVNFRSDAPNPISLKQIVRCDNDLSLELLLNQYLERLAKRYQQIKDLNWEEIATDYHNNLYRYGEESFFQDKDGMFEGRIINVNQEGALSIERKEGRTSNYLFKEVAYII